MFLSSAGQAMIGTRVVNQKKSITTARNLEERLRVVMPFDGTDD